MNTVVMLSDLTLQQEVIKQLKDYQLPNKNPHLSFFARVDGSSVSLYHSGKLVFQGKNAVRLAKAFGYHEELNEDTSSHFKQQSQSLIGSDEVGNGSYFGGLAVVASFVTPDDFPFLRELGVADSKTLPDNTICQIAPLLKQKIPHKSLLLSPRKYNEIVGDNKPYNAVSVKVALHNQAIFLLLQEGLQPDGIIVDAFTSQKNYLSYLKQEKNHFDKTVSLIEKAESQFLAVAVSSIIARQLFLENLSQLSQTVGISLPSGASTKSDKIASKLLKEQGMLALEETAKLHFANTKKAIQLLHS
ncbi:ribonuclease HIII [Streptococcus sciuri]|uniref:Ribonuclease HIII n=1 Tax=Streptococcus sciuri TaxID=2973939 RepID=A0ABT2F742_9STRE|nr:ribonuclease HIII [Streptococcus sciuri]MCS4488254.1 ribonuclease HIII [Streptococcus sciuri]